MVCVSSSQHGISGSDLMVLVSDLELDMLLSLASRAFLRPRTGY